MQPVLGINWHRQGATIVARLQRPADLPIAALVKGRAPDELADLLPRLFSICREAQGLAVRMALGLPVAARATEAVLHEVRRDHLLKLCLHWPSLLGLAGIGLPPATAFDDPAAHLLAGSSLPDSAETLDRWLQSGTGVTPLFAALDHAFAPGEAATSQPLVTSATALAEGAQDNSAAARQATTSFLQAVESRRGRGPLWYAAGCLAECAGAVLPAPVLLADGTAVVPAARGLYAVRAGVTQGRVVSLTRRTPTDHLTAPGSGLDQALARLPAAKSALLPLVVDILSPCLAVSIREERDA